VRAVIDRPEPAAGADGTKAVDHVDVLAAGHRGEAADAPIVMRLKSQCLRRECAGEEAFSRRDQEDPSERTGNLKFKCP
jgi:hypothetical protein